MNYAAERDKIRQFLTDDHEEGDRPVTQARVLEQLVYEEIADFLAERWAELIAVRTNWQGPLDESFDEWVERENDRIVGAWVNR